MVPEEGHSPAGMDRKGAVARQRAAVQQELFRLEAECRQRGVKLTYDDLRGEGGFCRVRSELHIIVNRRLSPERRIRIVRSCLERLTREQSLSVTGSARPAVEQSVETKMPSIERTSATASSPVGSHRSETKY